MVTKCLNCQNPVQPEDQFCSSCGQKNAPVLISTRLLVADLFNNIYAWDNRFFRSVRELCKPASLTIQFFNGKRQNFIPPARLYLFSVILHLAVLSYFGKATFFNISDKDRNTGKELVRLRDQMNVILAFQDSMHANSLHRQEDNLFIQQKYSVLEAEFNQLNDTVNFNLLGTTPLLSFSLYDLEVLSIDSLTNRIEDQSWTIRLLGSQFVKSYRNPKALGSFVVARLSWMMFLILPFVGLILALLYYRQKRYYIEHLIFALHYHVAAYLIVSIGVILDYFMYASWANGSMLVALFYVFLALKKYYGQGWFKTSFKFFALHLAYFFIFLALLSMLFIISFLLFA
ncbi:MAG: DUF3667 domain-containing protein [Saprospiraceae bacterium]|nr:DUF3667 domain-containing protein [Saprospiraceae bacterium]